MPPLTRDLLLAIGLALATLYFVLNPPRPLTGTELGIFALTAGLLVLWYAGRAVLRRLRSSR